MSEPEKCPDCGAEFAGPAYVFGKHKGRRWVCETFEHRNFDGEIDGMLVHGRECLRNQLSAANAKLAEAEAELKLWKPMTNEEIESALDAVEAAPLDEETIERIVAKVTDPTFRPTEPEHVLMAAKIKQLEAENERLRTLATDFANDMIEAGKSIPATPSIMSQGYAFLRKLGFAKWLFLFLVPFLEYRNLNVHFYFYQHSGVQRKLEAFGSYGASGDWYFRKLEAEQ